MQNVTKSGKVQKGGVPHGKSKSQQFKAKSGLLQLFVTFFLGCFPYDKQELSLVIAAQQGLNNIYMSNKNPTQKFCLCIPKHAQRTV